MTRWLQRIALLLYPPKCVLCARLLQPEQTDLCPDCRQSIQEANCSHRRIPHLAKVTALWYYEGEVRNSILRYKFRGSRSYGKVYGRLLAMKLSQEQPDFDLLTWAPISRQRKWLRGYDQVELIARSVGEELGTPAVSTLAKRRNNRAQSSLKDAAQRRANVLGVYRATDPALVAGKKILLLDDIITTGATASECARTLLTAGASQVICAAVAVSPNQRKIQ